MEPGFYITRGLYVVPFYELKGVKTPCSGRYDVPSVAAMMDATACNPTIPYVTPPVPSHVPFWWVRGWPECIAGDHHILFISLQQPGTLCFAEIA